MNFTLHIGWWIVPAIITVASLGSAVAASPERQGDYDFGYAAVGAIYLLGAVVLSLIAWLAWALIA